jgi:hypothetical protein
LEEIPVTVTLVSPVLVTVVSSVSVCPKSKPPNLRLDGEQLNCGFVCGVLAWACPGKARICHARTRAKMVETEAERDGTCGWGIRMSPV